MNSAPSKKALNFFAVVDQIKLVHRRLESEVDRIEQPGGAQILDSRQILAGRQAEMLQKGVGGLEDQRPPRHLAAPRGHDPYGLPNPVPRDQIGSASSRGGKGTYVEIRGDA